MSAIILSGKECAAVLLENLREPVRKLKPCLVIVQVGDNPASDAYIGQKLKVSASVGMEASLKHLPENTTFNDLLSLIKELNEDTTVTGFILQVPLPGNLQPMLPQLIRAIDPKKDVDGMCAYNLGKMMLSKEFEHLPPATPAGIITLLEHYGIDPAEKHVVIVGKGNLVGKPLAMMLLNRGATVTVCHRQTKDLAAMTRQADILIAAAGSPGLIGSEYVKKGAVVLDVGITHDDGKLRGDVDFDAVQEIASAITPVPGGVGPMTVASLIRNCVRAKERQLDAD